LDIGSTTTKAALVEVTDEVSVLHVARLATPADVESLIDAVATVSRECLDTASAPVAAVGIASMAESGAALGADGRALTPLLRWDRRVDRAYLDALLAAHPELPAATGIPATTKPPAVTLTALRSEQPDVHTAMRHWSGAADLVAHALTGTRATDHTLAARSMLAARGTGWDAAVLATLGLSAAQFPEIRHPGEPVGATSASARVFGLDPGVPVYVAGHDHAVGAWAAGVRRPGETADSLGTSEAVVRIADAVDIPRAVAEGFAVGRTVDGSAWTILGGSPAGGAMLAWWDAAHPDDRVLDRLPLLAPGAWTASATIVLPYPSGRQCPAPDPSAQVRVWDERDAATDVDPADVDPTDVDPTDVDPADLDPADARTRGLLQSLVSQARWMRETADALAGSPTTALTLLGSIARRVPAWVSLAAASGTPTHVATVDEPVAAGAALLAGVRAGVIDPDTAVLPRARVPVAESAALDGFHRRFLAAVHSPAPTTTIPSQGAS
jgi:xylulokinase